MEIFKLTITLCAGDTDSFWRILTAKDKVVADYSYCSASCRQEHFEASARSKRKLKGHTGTFQYSEGTGKDAKTHVMAWSTKPASTMIGMVCDGPSCSEKL